jgi:hypothetical protein
MTGPDWNGADGLLVFALGGYLALREALHRFLRRSARSRNGHARSGDSRNGHSRNGRP